MKIFALVVGIFLASGAIVRVEAYGLAPSGTKFTLSDQAAILLEGQFKQCTVKMVGKIPRHGQNAQILSFSDGGSCDVTGVGLPWKVRAKNATSVVIENFDYTLPDETCEPKTIHATIYPNGKWFIDTKTQGSLGPCVFTAELPAKPEITIIP